MISLKTNLKELTRYALWFNGNQGSFHRKVCMTDMDSSYFQGNWEQVIRELSAIVRLHIAALLFTVGCAKIVFVPLRRRVILRQSLKGLSLKSCSLLKLACFFQGLYHKTDKVELRLCHIVSWYIQSRCVHGLDAMRSEAKEENNKGKWGDKKTVWDSPHILALPASFRMPQVIHGYPRILQESFIIRSPKPK